MNHHNRTTDGRIATKKEAMRADCLEMVARYKRDAKVALQAGRADLAKSLVTKCTQLRAAFFADFGEPA